MYAYQAVQLRYRCFGSGLTDVPYFYAAFAAGVDVLGGIWNSYGAHDLAMNEAVDLTGMAGNPWPDEGVCRERHWLQLAVTIHVKRIGAVNKTWQFLFCMAQLVVAFLTYQLEMFCRFWATKIFGVFGWYNGHPKTTALKGPLTF